MYCKNCKKEMIYIGNLPSLDNQEWENRTFICGNCGLMTYTKVLDLDDEELKNFLENHEEQLKDTEIYKEFFNK